MTFAARSEGSSPSPANAIVAFPAFLDLTKSVAAGDETATHDFFQRYCDRLFRYALVITRGQEDLAREILSLTMIKAIRAMRPMESDADIWRWLTRIAWNCFLDHCRKTKRRPPTEQIPETIPAPSQDQALLNALNESVTELPLDEREIVERCYFEDESQADVAASIQTTRKAVESRLARIRQKLRAAVLQKLS